jgi:ADP-heptose:LPS heptosyltransferase
VRNFLLLQHQFAVGTAIHATPVFSTLRAALPGARIAVAASGPALQILQHNPHINHLMETPNPNRDLAGAVLALLERRPFHGEPFAALQTTGNERSAMTFAAMLSGGHTRVGFTTLPQLTTLPLAFDSSISQITNNLRLIAAIGHGESMASALAARPDLAEPQICFSAEHTATARALLQQQGIDESRPIAIFVTQTYIAQRKSWHSERFCSIATMLHRHFGMQIVFVGTDQEAAAIDELRSGLDFATVNIAGHTSLLELAALMSLADIALTLDTGPLHIARAVRLPMVIIAPAWSPPVEWLPLSNPRARILKNASLTTATDNYVIDEVSVKEVEQNLRELLEIYPPRTFTWRS